MKQILRLRGGVCSLNKLTNLNNRLLGKLGVTLGIKGINGRTCCIQKITKKNTCNSRVTGKLGLRSFRDAFWWFFTVENCIKKWWEFAYRFLHKVEMTRGKALGAYVLSLATIKILFCVCLAHAGQRGVGNPAATGVALATDSIKPLHIGDTIPDALWHLPLQMIKAGQEGSTTVTLNDYKGKLIILDFWATWCKPCIRAMPDLHALEKSFDKSVKVIPVTYEKSTTIEQFMEMASQRQLIPTNGFSSIVEDKYLSAYFPHKVVPHTLIIWDNSLLAITSPEYLTREIITEIIEQKKSTGLITKNEAIDADAFFLTAAYSQMNKHKPFYYTTIIPAIPSIRSNAAFINLGEKKVNRYYQVEKSILSLYAVTRAFGTLSPTNPHDVVLEVAYPEAYKYIANRNTTQKEELNWRNRHAYNYEAIFPEQIAEEEINDRLKIDLDFFFNLKSRIEERQVEILLLKRVKDRKVTGSKGGIPLMVIDSHVPARMVEQQRFVGRSSSGAKSYLMNFPIQTLLAQTKVNPYKVFPVLPPIVDSTDLPKDFLLDLEFDQTYPDSASLQRSLNEKGLYLEKSFVRKNVIVVSEQNYLQKTPGALRFSPYGYLPSNHPYFNSQIIK